MMNSSTPSAPESTNDMILTDDETAEELSADEVAIIFGFLSPYDIMHARVCTTWRDAAKKTVVPPSYESYYKIYNVRSYNAVRAMSTALPNLDQLDISDLEFSDLAGRFFSRGENSVVSLDINIISSFRKLRRLYLYKVEMHGRNLGLFEFPLLRVLSIRYCHNLKFDLDMLQGFPLLEDLDLIHVQQFIGNISSLRAFKGTLKSLHISRCLVRGNFMDLADFPHLKELELHDTAVTGDIRDIGVHDFPALESLCLPDTVHGGSEYKFQQISKVPSFMHTVHLLLQRTPTLFSKTCLSTAFNWTLSEDSPDWYEEDESEIRDPPFHLQFVRAGSRRGWSWCTSGYNYFSCEIHWLDPEPSCEIGDYGTYIDELQGVEHFVDFYRGYYQPPTEEEYHRLLRQLTEMF
eukprot:scaffold3013_cov112-Skeletonema_marinoi.AAC.7